MTALFISRIKVRDADKLAEYAQATGPLIGGYGGTMLRKGRFAKDLLGASDHSLTSIVQFPDIATAEAWYGSPEYRTHTDLREAAGDMQFVLYEVLGS